MMACIQTCQIDVNVCSTLLAVAVQVYILSSSLYLMLKFVMYC